ncbi:hypothetical protein MJO28_015872 [Puccinia striiformis f. sp. tritici]|uniref:Uncharacterized protein n=1 Tax=Puccinia striiformis f. sp. tritici TaxID=168172 RepID=A0ACC0DQ14_9BASI|nr:hypothetical protein MJO28_015872 [Puccinia striiformis f. sp. tritici]
MPSISANHVRSSLSLLTQNKVVSSSSQNSQFILVTELGELLEEWTDCMGWWVGEAPCLMASICQCLSVMNSQLGNQNLLAIAPLITSST